jgi:DNA polymerase III alpha subunit
VPFIHLRAHSSYSLSEGALPVKQLASLAYDLGMPALAITDTNNLFGALEFSETLAQKGIQPIIGCTLKVDFAGGARHQLGQRNGASKHAHLALIAKDEEGYGNLMRLSSSAWLDHAGVAEPHVGFAELEARCGGLICLTGGPGGPVNEALVDGQMRSWPRSGCWRCRPCSATACMSSFSATAPRPSASPSRGSSTSPSATPCRWLPATSRILPRLTTLPPTMR